MAIKIDSREKREKKRMRIRKKIHGTAERPRLSVFKSARHIYAQVIDDDAGATLAEASTLDGEFTGAKAKKAENARKVGALVAQRCLAKKIDKVVFDRGGFPYHGRIKALADAAREVGLKF